MSTNLDWLMILFTAVIAFATVATWLVYRTMLQLMRRTNEISSLMAEEARRNREDEFAPLVVLRYVGSLRPDSGTTGQSEAIWEISNKGRGPALDVVATGDGSGGSPFEAAALESGEKCKVGWLKHRAPFESGQRNPPIEARVSYSDVYLNRYESRTRRGKLERRRLADDEPS